MNDELYKQNILDHYKHPHHKGVLNPCNASAHAANKSCGDDLIFYLNVKEEKIAEVAFDGDGCAISVAGASMLSDTLSGMSLDDVRKLEESDILELFGVPIGPARSKCALLAYSALQEALKKI
jgi:nitrogen fixation protein NifU and related proteins